MIEGRGSTAIIRYYLVMVLCLLCSSCTKQRISSDSSDVVENGNNEIVEQTLVSEPHDDALLNFIICQEAMLVDIPIPLYDERILPSAYDETEQDSLVFGYKSPLTLVEVSIFFVNQMERYGWQHLISFNTFSQSILQFKSPDRYCTVVVNSDDNQSSSIFIYIKRASTDARSE